MKKILTVLSLAGGLALFSAAPAWADGFRSYQVCGGDQFVTCAAIEITVVGNNVTMRVWNLSGNSAVTGIGNVPANTIINGIGFYNVPAGVTAVTGTMTTTGPARPGNTPGDWVLKNTGKVSFAVDYSATSATGIKNGIASGCADPASLPGTPPQLYQNPCLSDLSNPANWVTFNFQITGGSWDPGTSDIVFRGKNGLTGQATECWTAATPGGRQQANCFATAAPEPITMTLLATGLASMGGAGLIRRRRNRNTVV